jgi:ribosomal protein S18 acetylase RimI-like enzyme
VGHNRRFVSHLLDNIIWNSLVGSQAQYSTGTDDARRYSRGFSPIIGFPDPHRPNFAALTPFCANDEQFYCDIWSGPAPDGWQIEKEATMMKMIWDAPMPEEDVAPDAIALGPEHAARAFELAQLTNPGPFGPRTPELGEYFGFFEGDLLIAMAGERMQAGSLREISGVCTRPGFTGRGLAGLLTLKLVRRQMERGQTPFLHVMTANTGARRLYEKLGFRNYLETVVRVVSRRK